MITHEVPSNQVISAEVHQAEINRESSPEANIDIQLENTNLGKIM